MLNIVFMGTPDFAAESLKALLNSKHNVVAVVTNPDKPKGRGMELIASPVKSIALENNIPLLQPAKIRDNAEFYSAVKSLNPDLMVVVAYGKLLPDDILAIPEMGCVNVHGSLLPKYRGASPVQSAVLNGDDETGVSTMYLSSGMDTGDIIYTQTTDIGPDETSGDLFDRLKVLGSQLLVKTVDDIEAGIAPRIPQNETEATYTVMLDKTMSPIDFHKSAKLVVRQIYGLQPWPIATATIGKSSYRVFSAVATGHVSDKDAGNVISCNKDGIEIVCGDGQTVLITEIQVPGKKRMLVKDFLAGNRIEL